MKNAVRNVGFGSRIFHKNWKRGEGKVEKKIKNEMHV
jgi:hypothetical protein